MQSRQKISTEIKFLASMDALPFQYLEKLHPSQVSRYKNYFNVQEYLGQELVVKSNDILDTIRRFNQHNFDHKVMKSYLRLAVVLRKMFLNTKHFHKSMLASKDEIIEVVQRIHHIIPIEKCANVIGMGESTLRSRITSVRVQCSGSLINLCRKVYPNQLLSSEVSAMKRKIQTVAFAFPVLLRPK